MKPGADERFMSQALALAARGLGETNPNPMVGCVVVRGGRVVGEGFHARAGGDHAEVLALRQAGPRASGATLYVTLEPCAHVGRTPACAPHVASSGVARVVVATGDPNPLVRGRGLRRLRDSGVDVSTGVLASQARRLNRRFLVAARERRPFVLLKAALTLDGRIATAAGDSRWITSPAQRRAARALRRLQDAVAVGIGTVLADDPLLMPAPRTRRPFTRVVFDSALRLPATSRLVATARSAPVIVLCAPEAPVRRRRALERSGVAVVPVAATSDGRVDTAAALDALFARGIWSTMVEGGGELLGSLLARRQADEIVLFRAPRLLGGTGSRPAFGGPDPLRVDQALALVPAHPAPEEWAAVEAGQPLEWWRPRRRGGA